MPWIFYSFGNWPGDWELSFFSKGYPLNWGFYLKERKDLDSEKFGLDISSSFGGF